MIAHTWDQGLKACWREGQGNRRGVDGISCGNRMRKMLGAWDTTGFSIKFSISCFFMIENAGFFTKCLLYYKGWHVLN